MRLAAHPLCQVFNHRSTKVIATIGPACWAPEKMRALLDAGISVARFDLGVGDLVCAPPPRRG
jgi:pyruvate kinase